MILVFFFIWRFHWVRGYNIGISDIGGGALPPPPQSEYWGGCSPPAPTPLTLYNLMQNYSGFGESELFYSMTVASYSVGAVISSFLAGMLTLCLPYISILLAGTILHTTSNLLYGLATQAWMIPLSRFMQGVSFRLFKVPTLTYISLKEVDYAIAYHQNIQSSKTKLDDIEKQEVGDTHSKKTWLILLTVATFLPALFGPGKQTMNALPRQEEVVLLYRATIIVD